MSLKLHYSFDFQTKMEAIGQGGKNNKGEMAGKNIGFTRTDVSGDFGYGTQQSQHHESISTSSNEDDG